MEILFLYLKELLCGHGLQIRAIGTSTPMVANHITPLVEEHYKTGTIDLVKMRSVDAVNSQCTTCSASQGGQMSAFSKLMKATINSRKK
ncbi:hypothetical protein [Flavobacterium sp. 2]|uniref:hypothetical protein n=1 Tax=Flavobacterium sp. 2 TaxID=308053 RepID=UPI00117A57E3|nr:hypothetical protein [Flavobacterium sp. 2]